MGKLESSWERLVNISGTMESRTVKLGSSEASWVNSWDWLGSRMVWRGYSWGMLVNNWERLASRMEKLENRMGWMGSRMDWLGNMQGKWVNSWEMLESTGLWENMKEKSGNTLGSMLRRFATENSVAKLVSSLERLASSSVTTGCSSGLLVNTVDLWVSNLDWSANSWGSLESTQERRHLAMQQHSLDCLVSKTEMHLEMTGSMET